ncbi:hypothetical protein Ancab_038533 [Ancistrocladus abbreviatus]
MGYQGFLKAVQNCLRNAHYLKDRLRDASISAMLNELSSTVVSSSLRTKSSSGGGRWVAKGDMAYVVVMPNVTVDKLNTFFDELLEKWSSRFLDGKCQPLCVTSEMGTENRVCPLHK